jgi:DNA-directed RNA polymerase specialized sigma24 family protein
MSLQPDGDKTEPERESLFPSTRWTAIWQARLTDSPPGEAALDRLLGRYWRAVYCYLRYKGYSYEAAKDHTQGFFHEIVLGRGLVQQADREKGRFRTFLLTALNRYLVSVHRAEKAKHRVPEGGFVSLQNMKNLDIPGPVHGRTSAEAFDYAWASALLDQVIAEVAGACGEMGKQSHWDVFCERVLVPVMDNSQPPSLPHLCQKYGIPTEAKASKMIFATKGLFRKILRSRVRELVDSDIEVDGEIHDLMKIFSGSGGRS